MAKTVRSRGSGSVYFDEAKDRYVAQVQIGFFPGTRRARYSRKFFKTKTEAVKAAVEMQSKADKGQIMPATGLTLARYLDEWLDTAIKGRRAPKTYALYRWLVAEHINPALGHVALEKLTRKDIQQFIDKKAKTTVLPRSDRSEAPTKTLSTNTLRNMRAVLSSALNDAVRDDLRSDNPAKLIVLPSEIDRKPSFLDAAEAKKLAEVATQDLAIGELVIFMLASGCRFAEAAGLRWQAVDFERQCIHIVGQLQRNEGKLAFRGTTKTNQRRTLPLSTFLMESLAARQGSPEDFVFLNPLGNPVDAKYFNRHLRRLCQEAGIQQINPHGLRHTAGHLLHAMSGDIFAVQKVLGHRHVHTTTAFYGNTTAETLRPIVNLMDSILTTPAQPSE